MADTDQSSGSRDSRVSSGSRDFPRVGIVCHPQINLGGPPVTEARRRLEQHGYRVWTYCSNPNERQGALTPNLDGTRLIVSIGGDGTMLWTAEQAAVARIPVLGINAGRLGFLTQVQLGDEGRALDRWAAGDFTLQRRALLDVRVGGRVFHALNDAVVHKGVEINLIRLEVTVDGTPAGQFDADGVIVSTPTGSTGYALSLGGPILHPEVRALVFMPLNPHSLFNRPIVLPEKSRITVKLPASAAILTCDGQQNAALQPGAEVEVAVGLEVSLVQFNGGPNFFDLLRRKLRWGLPLIDGDGE